MHTKGEWFVKDTDIFLKIDGKFTGYKLARVQRSVCFDVKISKEEVEANAQLMASSPDMVKVLEEVQSCLHVELTTRGGSVRMINAKESVDKILKKAKGE